jgi:hypothetical protein
MTFRESINNLIRSDKPESTSRALALFTGINVVGWIWYALTRDKMTALMACLAIVVAYITALLGVKQITEKKGTDNASTPPNP